MTDDEVEPRGVTPDAADAQQKGSSLESRARLAVVVLLLPLVSGIYLWQATQIPQPPRAIVVSPDAFPVLIGVLMVVSSVAVALQHLRLRTNGGMQGEAAEQRGRQAEGNEEDFGSEEVTSWKDVFATLVAFLLFAFFFERLGLVVSTGLFLMGLSTYFAPRRWLRNLLVSVAFPIAVSYLFTTLLGVRLTDGIFAGLF